MKEIANRPHMALSRTLRGSLRVALVVGVVAAAMIGVAWADGPAFHARVDRPVLYHGQLHAAGRIEIVPVGRGDLLSLRLDGHPAALMFGHALGPHHPGDVPEFCFRPSGAALELVSIRWSGAVPPGRVEVLIVVRAQPGRSPT